MKTALALSWIAILILGVEVLFANEQIRKQQKDIHWLMGIMIEVNNLDKKFNERMEDVQGRAASARNLAAGAFQEGQTAQFRIGQVDKRLKTIQRVIGPVTPKSADDFVQRREDYEGMTVKMKVVCAGPKDVNLRDYVAANLKANGGDAVPFGIDGKTIFIGMKPGGEGSAVRKIEDVPPLKYGEAAVVTFFCELNNNHIIDIKPE